MLCPSATVGCFLPLLGLSYCCAWFGLLAAKAISETFFVGRITFNVAKTKKIGAFIKRKTNLNVPVSGTWHCVAGGTDFLRERE